MPDKYTKMKYGKKTKCKFNDERIVLINMSVINSCTIIIIDFKKIEQF